ncbi:transcriptional regulator, XRE family (peptidase S24 LexA-like domain) [Campylobacter subantarcticus LMG 24377]|uniref:Transcriptional regulator, XRE family (Peptidase S24 LexA-like domain) n=2 Tax=Campylobacter subantarcticus TaxID=497724 RepID=A0A0A8HAY8_9BACT|nr:LexA family transcriptional regulator [Campylobacter subantarcticus]EAI8628738.1 LexA family transcriptional regulator [Campylobacter lari]AJC90830.1 transcriptional regulator, XRE family (peptidase S24 LexA-like domain) [Campylobacter subantarcticus LMG 24374]AJC92537.1 transcriptional regulator, XRE family (peptidase S24 LexA-like domain) [Campylobacter subantarcticus LMG 24377]EAJ1261716.1 LexA family transcriptional regulator [Campylobacter lari]EAL3939462.1 LexA family transcriptional 
MTANDFKQIREKLGLTQEQLGSELNLTRQQIINIEKGKTPISKKYFDNISKLSKKFYIDKEKNTQTKDINKQEINFYSIPKLNISASAGGGNELIGLEEYETGEMLELSKAFFKTTPKNLKAIKVDGYSMVPMLLPDSWVVFEETHEYQGDGLYILNFDNQLMVKLLQLNPISKILDIISVNKDYKSYSIDLKDSQIELIIQGKVLRSII